MISKIFDANLARKNKITTQALVLFKEGLGNKNIQTFNYYIIQHGDLFSPSHIERTTSFPKGMVHVM